MLDEIELTYVRHDTPYWERHIDVNTLLWPTLFISNMDTCVAITRAIARYLTATNMKV